MKSADMIYTGNCIKLARSPYILVPKMVDVNDVKPCKNVHTDSKSVAEFYDKKSVVITGANGFIGTILVSKLLRSCPGLETIYFLIREKNGTSIQTRMEELFSLPVSHCYVKNVVLCMLCLTYHSLALRLQFTLVYNSHI